MAISTFKLGRKYKMASQKVERLLHLAGVIPEVRFSKSGEVRYVTWPARESNSVLREYRKNRPKHSRDCEIKNVVVNEVDEAFKAVEASIERLRLAIARART